MHSDYGLKIYVSGKNTTINYQVKKLGRQAMLGYHSDREARPKAN